MPVEVLGDDAELDHQVAGKVLRFGFAALFLPEPQKRRLIVAHDDPGVRAAKARRSDQAALAFGRGIACSDMSALHNGRLGHPNSARCNLL